jgi:hypothetical protein
MPDADRRIAWALHDFATGAPLGTVVPGDVDDRFVVVGGVVLFEGAVGGASGDPMIAFDPATGVERWRAAVGSAR